MNYAPADCCGEWKTSLANECKHGSVYGKHVGAELSHTTASSDLHQLGNKERGDAAPLQLIHNQECNVCYVSPLVKTNISAFGNDHFVITLAPRQYQRDMSWTSVNKVI